MKCPKCTSALQTETYEGIEIDRCSKCGGTWLDEGELVSILELREEKLDPKLVEKTVKAAFAGVPEAKRSPTHPCPKCSKPMLAVNHAYDSGVLIDRCPDSEGVWLDQMELEQVQAYREKGDQLLEQNRGEWALAVKAERAAFDEQARKSTRRAMFGTVLGALRRHRHF